MHFLGLEIDDDKVSAVVLNLDQAQVIAREEEACGIAKTQESSQAENSAPQECDAGVWIRAVQNIVKKLAKTLGGEWSKLTGIGISGVAGGMVVMDRENRLLRPARLSTDMTAEYELDALGRGFGGRPGLIEILGNYPRPGGLAAQLLWLKAHEPEVYEKTDKVFTIPDFLSYWLSGEFGSTVPSMVETDLFSVPERNWSREVVEFIDPAMQHRLPPLVQTNDARGWLRRELAEQWGLEGSIVVASGLSRDAAKLLANGVYEPGTILIELGEKSTIIGLDQNSMVDFLGEARGGIDVLGNGFIQTSINNVIAAPEAVCKHYGWTEDELKQAVAASPIGAGGLLFLPYFRGDELPQLIDPGGVLHGMTVTNFTPANVARAAVEGVALEFGYALSRIREIGVTPHEILVSHPSDVISMNLLADVCGLPCINLQQEKVQKESFTYALGAAMQAAVIFFRDRGEEVQFAEIASYIAPRNLGSQTTPNMENEAEYGAMLARRQYLVETLQGEGFL